MNPPALGLAGRRVLVTRAAAQAAELLALLRARGAEPIACPTIAIEPPDSYELLDESIRSLARYDWLTFTSANAVRSFADRVEAGGMVIPASVQIAAVGVGTARALSHRLRAPSFVPTIALAARMAEEFPDPSERRVLFPRGHLAREVLPSLLRARGAVVDEVVAYRTVPGEGVADFTRLMRCGGIDAILFMSASSVRLLGDAVESMEPSDDPPSVGPYPVVVCIGPETARAAREAGVDVSTVATEKSAQGVVDALEREFARRDDVAGR